MAASAVGVLARACSSCSRSPRRRATRRCSPASTPPRPARSPPRSTRRASSTRSRTTAPRLASSRARSRRRASRSPRRACPARASPASSCSTSRSSAPPTSSRRSPTSARSRARSPRRSARSRASPARRSRSCSPRTSSSPRSSRRPPPRSCSAARPPSLDPSAVRGIASLVPRSVKGLKPQNVSITDASGTLLWPNSDSGGRRHRHRQQAHRPGALQHPAPGQPRRDAHPDARRRQGPRPGLERPQRRRVDARQAHLRQEGRPAQDDRGDRAPARRRLHAGGATGSASNLPSYAAARRGGCELQLPAQVDPDGLRRRQDRPAHEGRARARSTA